jgi:chromosome segregation and condensation protein ScpB
MTAQSREQDVERIRAALVEADEPLTARELRDRLEERGLMFESAHQVATVLGNAANRGAVEVIHSSPYRYRVPGDG